VGFLKALPDELPEQAPAHRELDNLQNNLQPLIDQGNVFAQQLLRIYRPEGQAFLKTVKLVMKKPSSQDVVIALMEAIESYFASMRITERPSQDINELMDAAEQLCAECEHHAADLHEVLTAMPELKPVLKAMLVLSWMGEKSLNPIFSKTDAIGSAMRRKLEPLFTPLNEQMNHLYAGGR
jgi:hypothetical protein